VAWLSRFVEHMCMAEDPAPRRISRLPDGRTLVVFRVHEGGRSGDLTVAGPRTRAHFKIASGVARWLVIELKRGWSTQLLGVPASTLTDRIVHLHDLWGAAASELCARLVAARSMPETLELLSQAFVAHTERTIEPASARLARRAVRMLETENVQIANVADRLGVTSRHLRRAFLDNIGVGPKDFARAVRLQRVVEHAGPSADWGRIAANTGYYDQAHLISDFRELVGVTPGAFAKRSNEI
jgi:AraC-like DNA-binding protein